MSCSLILSSRVGGPLCGQTPGLEGPGNRPSPLGGHSPQTPALQSHSDSLPWDRGVAPSTARSRNAGLCVPSAATADPLVHRAGPACRWSVGAGLPKSGSRPRSLSPVWPRSGGGRTPLTCPSPGFSEKGGRCLGGAVRPSEARAPHLQEPLLPHPCTPLCNPVPSSHCAHVLLSVVEEPRETHMPSAPATPGEPPSSRPHTGKAPPESMVLQELLGSRELPFQKQRIKPQAKFQVRLLALASQLWT